MQSPEYNPHQHMANALAARQWQLAERELRNESPGLVHENWGTCEQYVDGIDPQQPDGMMDPGVHADIIDDLTRRSGRRETASRAVLIGTCVLDLHRAAINDKIAMTRPGEGDSREEIITRITRESLEGLDLDDPDTRNRLFGEIHE